jgi:hypothetical protein
MWSSQTTAKGEIAVKRLRLEPINKVAVDNDEMHVLL